MPATGNTKKKAPKQTKKKPKGEKNPDSTKYTRYTHWHDASRFYMIYFEKTKPTPATGNKKKNLQREKLMFSYLGENGSTCLLNKKTQNTPFTH